MAVKKEDVIAYLEKANKRGSKIKYIFETHLHADFISGHITLAKKTGADIVGLITNEKTTGDMVASEVLDMDCSTIHFFIRPYKFCKVNEYIKVEEIKEEKPVKVYKFKSAKEVQKYQLSKHKWEYK